MTTATPEQVSAILRSDGPLYPSRIGVYCDTCGTAVEGEYVVSEQQTRAERLEVARTHMRAAGWRCDQDGDVCPGCQGATAPHGPQAARAVATQLAESGEHSHLSVDGNTVCLSEICPVDPIIDIAHLSRGSAR